MTEIWKSIAGYEGLYEVSTEGNVRSLKFGKTRILKPQDNGTGYLHVKLCKDGKVKNMRVHRLVAQAFLPNPLNLETVNHKDENKANNSASNLEWMSQADNNNYGTHNQQISEANVNNPKKSKPVQQFDKHGKLIATFPSIIEASRQTEISDGSICQCCNGRRKSAGGFVWRYAPGENSGSADT